MTVTCTVENSTGIVTLDNPPVNAIGHAVRQGLLDAVEWAEAEGLSRVIVTGAGRAFAAGADAREFDAPPVEPHLPDVLNRIEASTVPWIAAINGVALGGGAEVVLACRLRIIAPGAQIGLPEVSLGVVPGAGGTQRLPRLIGLGPALEIIAMGKPVSAAKALALGFCDQVDADPVAAAKAVPMSALAGKAPVSTMPPPPLDAAAIDAARALAASKMRGQLAPMKAIDTVALACSVDFTTASATERQTFLDLRYGDQARALRHMFFAERAARAPGWLVAEPAPVASVAVVGGGTMGAGIAYAMLNAGMAVTVLETDPEGAERARANVERIIGDSLKRGLIDDARAEDHRSRFAATDDYSAAANADLAIEAAFESLAVKTGVFARLEAETRPDCVLATNTSYLDLDEIAATMTTPERLVGLHFFAPAHVMRLLEIVQGARTEHRALATGFALAKTLRKVPVLAGVCDGFIGNRILARYREAADALLMDGAAPWEIDEAMRDFGYAMGPYEAQDLSGLDIAHANRKRQAPTRDPARRYIPIQDRMVAEGRLGRKAGVGWYRYPGGNGPVIDPLIEDLIREEAHFAGVTRRDFTADEIREQLLLAMINEAADILQEGIAQTATDIDLVTVFGYGFPRWRGGLMHHADTLGAGELARRIAVLAETDPVVWRLSPAIAACAADGRTLAEYRPGGG